MRHVVFCLLLVLGLPQVAAAAAIGAAVEPIRTGGGAALDAAAPPVGSPAALDLRIDGTPPRVALDAPDGASEAERAGRDIGTYQPHSDRGVSFGLEIKPRSRIGALARQDQAEDPSLGDQLQRLIERPVFGFRGRYRF